MQKRKFQLTTFDKFSSQFSRVANSVILAGLSQDGLKAHTAHLSLSDALELSVRLNSGQPASFYSLSGELCIIQEHLE
jgi:hypothetical protein